MIAIQRRTIQINAAKYICAIKNRGLHVKLIISCTKKIISALFLYSDLDPDTINEDMPIRKNSMVHTTGNTAAGGVSGGCFIELNTSLVEFMVRSADKAPVPRLKIIKNKNLFRLNLTDLYIDNHSPFFRLTNIIVYDIINIIKIFLRFYTYLCIKV